MTQFREPWHIHDTPERCWIHDSAEHYVCGTKDSVERPPERAALAERIVACVNFCANVPTEFLSATTAEHVIDDRFWKQQPDGSAKLQFVPERRR